MKSLEITDWDDSEAISDLVGQMALGNEPGWQVDEVSEVDELLAALECIANAYLTHVGERTYFNTTTDYRHVDNRWGFYHGRSPIPHIDTGFRALAVHHELAEQVPVKLASLRARWAFNPDALDNAVYRFSPLFVKNRRQGKTAPGRLTVIAESSLGNTHPTLHLFDRLSKVNEWTRYAEGIDSPDRSLTVSEYVLDAVGKAIKRQARNTPQKS